MTTRDPRTGRFVSTANTPESGEGKFETYTDLPVENVSGAPSGNTIDRPRYSPAGDDLAQGGSRFPLYARHPVLVSMDEQARTQYGTQGALTRDFARLHGVTGTLGYVLGVDDSQGPSSGVRDVFDDVPGVQDVPGGLRPVSRGQGRGRDR